MIPGDALECFTQQLFQASTKGNPAHGVKQEINAEVCVVQEHKKLLQTPEQCRSFLARQREEKHAESYHVATEKYVIIIILDDQFRLTIKTSILIITVLIIIMALVT